MKRTDVFIIIALVPILLGIISSIKDNIDTKKRNKIKSVPHDPNNFNVSKTNLINMSGKLYEAMEGRSLFGITDPQKEKNDLIEICLLYNDDELGFLIEHFNKNFASTCWSCNKDDTLLSWVQTESNLDEDLRKLFVNRIQQVESGIFIV